MTAIVPAGVDLVSGRGEDRPERSGDHLQESFGDCGEQVPDSVDLCRYRHEIHKICNVEAKLSKTMGATVARKIRAAYHDPDPLAAEGTPRGVRTIAGQGPPRCCWIAA